MKRVTVHLSAPLRPLVKGKPRVRVQVEGETLGDLLVALAQQHRELAAALINEEEELRPHVAMYVGDDDARHAGRLSAPLRADVHVIVPTVV
jgi:molybdopterin synthase sulfur carrier subunit